MQCFDMTAKKSIHESIIGQHGSLKQFTVVLKLRLLLRPMRYDGDCEVNSLKFIHSPERFLKGPDVRRPPRIAHPKCARRADLAGASLPQQRHL